MAMIPESEVHFFLKDKLGITNVHQRYLEDRASLLDDIIKRFLHVIPFQTLTQVSLTNDAKQIPTLEENIKLVLSGQGGLCWTLNTSMLFILQALGYEAFPGLCEVTISETPWDNHIILIVKNLRKPGDYHLVDVGMSVPTFRSIPLDFETESPVYRDSCETYKFVKKDGKILRLHKTYPEGIHFSHVEGEWGYFCRFTLDPCPLGQIGIAIDKWVYSQVDYYFCQNIYFVVFPDGKLCSFKNKRLILETEEGKLITTDLKDDQLVPTLRERLPDLPESVITSATEQYLKNKENFEWAKFFG